MSWAETITSPGFLAGVLGAVACFATVLTVAGPLLSEDQIGARLKEVAKRREDLRKKSRADLAAGPQLVRKDANKTMQDVVKRLDLQRHMADDNLQSKLMRAGFRGPASITKFYFYRLALPISFAIAAFLYVMLFGESLKLSSTQEMAVVVGALALGYYAPNIYLTNIAQKRRDAIMGAFPDSLDMLLICVESGMSIELALARVGSEIAPASVELAEELQLTCAELSYLPERRMAYENLARRCDHPGVRSVAMALTQAEKYGTPLGSALRVMAKENRELRISAAEKKAAALPAKLTVPMIVFFLPVLFMVILGPAIIQISAMMKGG